MTVTDGPPDLNVDGQAAAGQRTDALGRAGPTPGDEHGVISAALDGIEAALDEVSATLARMG